MYQDTVTIYCKREEKYLPRVLHGVEAQLGTAATAKAFGIESASNGLLLVPLELKGSEICTLEDGLKYMRPKQWENTEEISQAVYFGANECFIVAGSTSFTGSFEQIKSMYDDVYLIASVTLYNGILPHLEVILK